MTRGELTALDVLIGEFRDFRDQDSRWKDANDVWRREVDSFITAERTKDIEVRRTGMTRRARAALFISAAGVAASIVIGVANLLT